jgi:hypothetical protein
VPVSGERLTRLWRPDHCCSDHIVMSADELAILRLIWEICPLSPAEVSAKTQGSGKQPTGQSNERQPGSAGGRLRSPKRHPEPPRASAKLQLGRFDGTCRKAPSTRATVRSWVRASVCTGKGNLRFHWRTSREYRPATQLR